MSSTDYKNFRNNLLKKILRNENYVRKNNTVYHDCVWTNINMATQILLISIREIGINATEKESILIRNFINVLSDILNSFLSVTAGFLRGPGVILRSVIESIACLIVIKMDVNKFNQYINNKLDPTSQITPAKKYFKEIGQINGMLTNTFVHEKIETINRCTVINNENIELSLLPNIEDIDFQFVYLLLISRLSRFVGGFCEYCFQDKFSQLHYWTRTKRNTLKENKNTNEDLKIQKLIEMMPKKYVPEN